MLNMQHVLALFSEQHPVQLIAVYVFGSAVFSLLIFISRAVVVLKRRGGGGVGGAHVADFMSEGQEAP